MAQGFCTEYADAVLGHIFGGSALAYGAGHHIRVHLFNDCPGELHNGTLVTGDGYNYVDTVPADWESAADGAITNHSVITFPAVVSGTWDEANWYALYDADNSLWIGYGQLKAPVTAAAGDTPRFLAGDLVFTLEDSGYNWMDDYREPVLDHVFGKATLTRCTDFEVHLYNVIILADGTGGTEVSGDDYAAAVMADTDWDNPGSASVKNVNTVAFVAAGASGWTEASYFAIWDDTNDLWIGRGVLANPETAADGDVLRFVANDLVFNLD
jgi:hypothetical protein